MRSGLAHLVLFGLTCSASASSKLPHILLIVADDLGWHDVGFRSHQIRTPNIDQLASEGVVLDQYYVQSVCSPSRATFMTGRYPLHNTVNDWLVSGTATGLPLNETLIPQKLAEAGYRNYATGKWHLGFTSWEHTPTFRGFESFVGFYSGGEDYFGHIAGGGYDFHRDMRPRCGAGCSKLGTSDKGNYSTFVFTTEAVRVIQEHDASEPLFLYLAYQAVHAPREVPKQYSDAYVGVIEDSNRRGFAGMLTCMDEGIGNVTAALKAKGMLDNSLIFFTTDNGGPTPDSPGGDYVGSRNFPLRGGKHSIWEGGTRGTAVVWAGAGTGLLPDERRGTQASQLMHGADLLPTFCGIAGIAASCARLPLDGVDQSGQIFRGSAARRQEVFYGQHDDAASKFKPYDTAIRDGGGWKLLQGWGGKPDSWSQPVNDSCSSALLGNASVSLFNVLDDPGEHKDVAASNTAVVERLQARLGVLRSEQVVVVGGGGHPDPACPTYKKQEHVDPVVGPFWEPWCEPKSHQEEIFT